MPSRPPKILVATRVPPVDHEWLERKARELGVTIAEAARRVISDSRLAEQKETTR